MNLISILRTLCIQYTNGSISADKYHKWIIQRNWRHRAHKTKTSKAKTQHKVCSATIIILDTLIKYAQEIIFLLFLNIDNTYNYNRQDDQIIDYWYL